MSTRLKILGILRPTAATPYVAIITSLVPSLIVSYVSLRSFTLTLPLMKVLSGISSANSSPAEILSTSINVLPDCFTVFNSLPMYSILSLLVTRYFNSS